MKWQKVAIRKLCLPTRQRDPRDMPSEEFSYIDISSIDRDSKVISQASRILGSEAPSRARKEIESGDILISSVRPNLNAVAIVPPELDGQIASTGFCVLRPDSEFVIGKYLFYYSRTPNFIETLCAKVRGAHYPAVSDKDVTDVKIPLPPISEQRRIVEILDQVDALRKKRAEADAKAAQILPALFYKMFGDPATNPKHWPLQTLGQIAKVQCGFAFKSVDFVTDGVFLTRISNLVDGLVRVSADSAFLPSEFVERYKTYHLACGDLLIALSGATTGKLARFEIENRHALLNQRVGRFLVHSGPRSVLDYLQILLQSPYARMFMQMEMQGGGQPNLAPREIESLIVPRPPDELFNEFESHALSIRKSMFDSARAKEYFDKLFITILNRSFTTALTARWREAHMKELLTEMEIQAKLLNHS